MNLTGRWQGHYTYGNLYPPKIAGKSEPFIFELSDGDGNISGSCTDPLVEAKEGNESYILGTFKDKILQFKKRYKYHFTIDEEGNRTLIDKPNSNGIDYTGTLRRKFFSRRIYFTGRWTITSYYKFPGGETKDYVFGGTWKMFKVD